MASLVVALNPSIDVEWRVDQVRWEEKNVVRSERRWPGGKGVNVARWLRHFGGEPLLLLPLGGQTGEELAAGLREEKLPTKIIPLCEPTRANVIVSASKGGQMRFNPAGPKLSRREWGEILKTVERVLGQRTLSRQPTPGPSQEGNCDRARADAFPSWEGPGVGSSGSLLILSGSLPRGVPVTAYSQLIHLARRLGVKTLLDCDGPPFAAAIKARPFLVKPNVHELAEWWGAPLRSLTEIQSAAFQLSGVTSGWVLVSCGAQGACLINRADERVWTAAAPRIKVRNTVGAGDALLAAVAHQIESQRLPREWLRSGVAVGAGAAQCAAGQLPKQSVVRQLTARVRVADDVMRDA